MNAAAPYAPITQRLQPRSIDELEHACDRCGANAKATMTLTSGGSLLLCEHHAREVETRLPEGAAVTYHDEP